MKTRTVILVASVSACIVLSSILGGSRVYIGLDKQILRMSGRSMLPTLKAGDLLIAQSGIAIDEVVAGYGTGDIIVFSSPSDSNLTVVHRAVEKIASDGDVYLKTKGDYNPTVDPWRVYDHQLAGKVLEVNSLPAIVLSQSVWWLTAIGLLVMFSMFTYDTAKLGGKRREEKQVRRAKICTHGSTWQSGAPKDSRCYLIGDFVL